MKTLTYIASVFLAGCVVVVQPSSTPRKDPPHDDHTHEVAITLPEEFMRPIPQPPTPQPIIVTLPPPSRPQIPVQKENLVERVVTVEEPCERFVWPTDATTPPPAGFLNDVLTNKDIDEETLNYMLLDYVDSLREYIETSYVVFREEYKQYVDRCGYEFVEDLPPSIYER